MEQTGNSPVPSAAAQSLARRLREKGDEARHLATLTMVQQATQAPALFASAFEVFAEAVEYIGARRDG